MKYDCTLQALARTFNEVTTGNSCTYIAFTNPPHDSISQLELLFQEDFNCPPSKLFRSFECEPVAAASLAQVFRAVTQEGQEVAVKAQYIDLRDRYDGDIWTIKVLLKIVAFIHPKFSLSWVFEVNSDMNQIINRLEHSCTLASVK